jgi:phosphoglycolate phosphatase
MTPPTTDGLPARFPLIWPRVVVFDLDGTLVDTVEDIAAALNAALAELLLPPLPVATVRLMVGGGLAELMRQALAAHGTELDDAAYAKAVDRLFELYAERPVQRSTVYDGALPLLRELRQSGILCGLCTNKPQAISVQVLAALGLDGAFACVQGGDSGFPKKPNPAGLKHLLSTLGVSPKDAAMLGDSAADVAAARGAGLAAIVLVAHGYSKLPASELGADMVIEHLSELPQSLALLAERG